MMDTMTTNYTREQAIEAIEAYFTDNEDDFIEAIESLDSWDGYLGDDRYYYMEDLNEFYHGEDVTDILARAFYGYDEDTWHIESNGKKVHGEFNPNRDYFRFNGYGNLVSADYKDYSANLDKWFIEHLIDNVDDIEICEEVREIIENIED